MGDLEKAMVLEIALLLDMRIAGRWFQRLAVFILYLRV